MASFDHHIRVLARRTWLWPWQRQRLLAHGDADTAEALLQAALHAANPPASTVLLANLCALVDTGRLGAWCGGERLGERLAGASLALAERLAARQVHPTAAADLECLSRLLARGGSPASTHWRRLLAAPVLRGARRLSLPRHLNVQLYGGPRAVSFEVEPKLPLLTALSGVAEAGDAALACVLTLDLGEGRRTRAAAAGLWARLAPEDALPPVLEALAARTLDEPPELKHVAARHTAWLAGRLADGPPAVRLLAGRLLVQAGRAAVDDLIELIRHTASDDTRRDAERVLGRIDRDAVLQAVALREYDADLDEHGGRRGRIR